MLNKVGRRLLVGAVMLLTLLMLLGTFALAEPTNLAGEWALTSIIQEGDALNPADLGLEMTLTLSEDGTAWMVTSGEEDMSGSWTAIDTGAEITMDGDVLAFVLEDGKLVAESDGMRMVFEKLGLPGIWYLESIVEDGTEYLPAEVDMEMVLTLNEDGTAVMTATDEEDMFGLWVETEDGLEATLDGMFLPLSLIDGYLITDVDGMAFVFGRKAADPFDPGTAIAADAVEAFNGTWECVKIDMLDMVVDADAMGMSSTLFIENGVVTQGNYYTDSEFWGEDTMLLGNVQLVDGRLNLTGEDFDGAVAILYDSGMLAVVQPYAGIMEFTYYYELTE